jgi:hypothetical protein
MTTPLRRHESRIGINEVTRTREVEKKTGVGTVGSGYRGASPGFEGRRAVSLDVCRLLEAKSLLFQRFNVRDETYNETLKMKATRYFETSTTTFPANQRNIPQYRKRRLNRHVNLKTHTDTKRKCESFCQYTLISPCLCVFPLEMSAL